MKAATEGPGGQLVMTIQAITGRQWQRPGEALNLKEFKFPVEARTVFVETLESQGMMSESDSMGKNLKAVFVVAVLGVQLATVTD